MDEKKGTLYICSTPIGNLEDVSLRLLRTLKEVDIIAAEDTRRAGKLLGKYEISGKRLISFHEHSTGDRIEYIIQKLKAGTNVGLVSESGTPSIQDPGYRIINACIKNDIKVTVIPGPNAAISALVLSGLPTDSFLFSGFLPKTKIRRKNQLLELAFFPHTLIFYESPNRIRSLISEMIEVFGNRKASLSREITKMYEEVLRGTLDDILQKTGSKKIKGEIVLVVDGYKGDKVGSFTEKDIEREFMALLKQGISKKKALKIILARYDIDRQKLYNISTKI